MPFKDLIIDNLNTCPKSNRPTVVTIGNFDGVHLGHQAVLKRARDIAVQQAAPFIVITFSNHPLTVLKPDLQLAPLCSNAYRYRLIAAFSPTHIVTLAFTNEFAQQSAEEFLTSVNDTIPFSHLILGYDACIGKDRQGNREQVEAIAQKSSFSVQYLEAKTVNGSIVSSTRIRNLIQQGQLDAATPLLGRHPSFYGIPAAGQGLGRTIGFPTLNLDVTNLCLPPLGVYAITCKTPSANYAGVANLGIAPTVRNDGRILLEASLFNYNESDPNVELEISLGSFIRPEKKFANVEELKQQLAKDVAAAKALS